MDGALFFDRNQKANGWHTFFPEVIKQQIDGTLFSESDQKANGWHTFFRKKSKG